MVKIVKVAIIFFITLGIYVFTTYILKVEYLSDVKEKLARKFLKRGTNA